MIIDKPKKADMPALRALWQEAFGDGDAFLDSFFSTAYSPERSRVATIDGAVAGALYWLDCECNSKKIAYIYAVATAKAQRGNGVCTALMRNTHAQLKTLGYVGAILVPGEPSLFEFYKTLDYTVCSSVDEISVCAAALPCRITKIDKRAYERLRRGWLADGDVLQERESIDFLATFTELYEGEDFILAARRDGNTLVGTELLGNASPDNLAAITSSLGAKRATFRTPGVTKPFAMYLHLESSHAAPKYFGIAFD